MLALFEDTVWNKERIRVIFRSTELPIFSSYPHDAKLGDDKTVGQLIARIKETGITTPFVIVDGFGNYRHHPLSRLGDIRESYQSP